MEDSLYTFIDDITGGDSLRVQDDLGQGFVRLRAAEAQWRQAKQDIRTFEDVVIELLRNARDAGAHAIFAATWTEGRTRYLTILDDGCGIPPEMHETVFEPFVTSKLDSFHSDRWGVHGRGMALYSIRENTTSAKVVCSGPGMGSVFAVESDIDVLPEKRDQSTVPTISRDETGHPMLRGPHNITRTVLEFAIDERDSIAVYLGSCAEIVATLHALASGAATKLDSLFEPPSSSTPYLQRFGFACDAEDLAAVACACSLPISERTAHRIVSGQIASLKPHLAVLDAAVKRNETEGTAAKGKRTSGGISRVHIAQDDLKRFEDAVLSDFRPLASAYYLDEATQVTAKVQAGELVVKIPLNHAE